jgi:hypothetical protein
MSMFGGPLLFPLALLECQICDPFCDPLALPTAVFYRLYCARRVLHVIETRLLAGFESHSLRHLLPSLQCPEMQG